MRKIDDKFYIENELIIKIPNGEVIPDDEPLFLFRARDYLALPILRIYKILCEVDHCTQYQTEAMDKMIEKFEEFKKENPSRMKQPGITCGK